MFLLDVIGFVLVDMDGVDLCGGKWKLYKKVGYNVLDGKFKVIVKMLWEVVFEFVKEVVLDCVFVEDVVLMLLVEGMGVFFFFEDIEFF